MVETEFANFINRLCLFFERKQPSMETLSLWFQDLRGIPGEPLPWIADKIKALENFPRNLPGAIKLYWGQWLDANPGKRLQGKEYGCHNCSGGYIQVSRFEKDLGRHYNITFRCASCKPKHPQSMTLATPDILLVQGYCKPIGYLTSLKYADILPDPPGVELYSEPVPRGPVDGIVNNLVSNLGG